MPRSLTIEPHLSIEQLKRGYTQATHPTQARHYQTIWLLSEGRKTSEVAQITGYSLNWIYELVRSYNRQGSEAIGDKRAENQGKKPLLDDHQQALLWQALQQAPEDGGVWSGPKVAMWMSELLGHQVHPQRGWEYLKGLGYRLRRPRPHHRKSDEVEHHEWKKSGCDPAVVVRRLERAPSNLAGGETTKKRIPE